MNPSPDPFPSDIKPDSFEEGKKAWSEFRKSRDARDDSVRVGGIKFPAKRLIPKGGNDKVYTPDWLAEAIVGHYKPCGSFLEPCSGGGAFVRAAKKFGLKNITTWEIDEGYDFLEMIDPHPYEKFDWSISNINDHQPLPRPKSQTSRY
jgi:hypothetical protein